MTIYILILAILFVLSFLDYIFHEGLVNNDFKKISYWIIVLCFVFFAGLRLSSPDINAYEEMFSEVKDNNLESWKLKIVEPGYILLLRLISFSTFQVSLLVIAFIGVFLKAKFFLKYSPYLFLSLAIYFTTDFMIKEMGQIRHGIAMAIVLWSYDALFKKNKHKFFILVALAISFHYSAICILPIYFIHNLKKENIFYITIIGCLFPFLFIDVKNILFQYISYLPIEVLATKGDLYENSEYSNKIGINTTFILLLIVFGMLLYLRKNAKFKPEIINSLINIYFIGIIYFMIFNSISEFSLRTNTYFRMLDIIILPMFVYHFKDKILGILLCILILLNTFITLNNRYNDKSVSSVYFPYQSIFNNN